MTLTRHQKEPNKLVELVFFPLHGTCLAPSTHYYLRHLFTVQNFVFSNLPFIDLAVSSSHHLRYPFFFLKQFTLSI